MNTPYVKKFDENGVVTNPIIGKYKNESPNRRENRLLTKNNGPRFTNNRKGIALTVLKTMKYKRLIQVVTRKVKETITTKIMGKELKFKVYELLDSPKRIEHYA